MEYVMTNLFATEFSEHPHDSNFWASYLSKNNQYFYLNFLAGIDWWWIRVARAWAAQCGENWADYITIILPISGFAASNT
jgi:hypothetical protein